MTTRTFAFLSAGPRFGLDLPSDFEPTPNLSSPFTNGRGGRSFDFTPEGMVPDFEEEGNRFVNSVRGRDGRRVDVFAWDDTDPVWWLRWDLMKGALITHLREEDGLEMAAVTADAVTVVEDRATATPTILVEPPLRRAVSNYPGFQELASFRAPSRGDVWSVELQRPNFVARGRMVQVPEEALGGKAVFRAGAAHGVEVKVTSGYDKEPGRELANKIANSLTYL